jgi:methionyl aminopeptidase
MSRGPTKTTQELDAMRQAGAVAARVLREASQLVVPGLTTGDLDRQIGEIIRSHGATSAFYRYRDFPGQCCISVNEGVIHGIGGVRRLQFGDLVKLDIGVRYKGFVGDVAMSVAVGECGRRRVFPAGAETDGRHGAGSV